MARGRATISQRIALEGGEEIRRQLAEVGKVGEKAFADIQKTAQSLTGPNAEFGQRMKQLQRDAQETAKAFEDAGQRIQRAGQALSTWVTIPITAGFAGVLKTAGDFEAVMNRVQAATQASAKEFTALEAIARKLGLSTSFSSKEAAEAIESLAKNGVSVKDILGGALSASLKLAEATGGKLAPAADLVTDVMQIFKKKTEDLPKVIDNISGTLLNSKFSFDDYRTAVSQGGGAIAGLGVTFKDFNTGLAATSSLFASGSDAGTAFKTFIQRLVPASKEAGDKMRELGLVFFDSAGKTKPLVQIAELLKQKLSGLSDEAKNDVLTTIFGADALRTAIGLMEQGSAGFTKLEADIAKVKAADQAASLMKGFNAAVRELGGAFEELGIAIGKSGVLEIATGLVKGLTELVRAVAALPAPVLATGAAIAVLAAALGPGAIAVGLFARGIGFMFSTVAKNAGLLATLAKATGPAGTAFTILRTAAAGVAGVFGGLPLLIIGAVAAVGALAYQLSQVDWKQFSKDAIPVILSTRTTAVSAFEGIKSAGGSFFTALGQGLETYVVTWAGGWIAIGLIARNAYTDITASAGTFFSTMKARWDAFWASLTVENLKAMAKQAWVDIKESAFAELDVLKQRWRAYWAGMATDARTLPEQFAVFMGDLSRSADEAGQFIKDVFFAYIGQIGKNWSDSFIYIRDTFNNIMTGIQDGWKALGDYIGPIVTRIGAYLDGLAQRAISVGQTIANALRLGSSTSGNAQGGFATPAYSRGGSVWGAGTSTSDSIPARLSAGEYVIRASAVKHYGSRLFALLNGMRLPSDAFRGFSVGGLVESIGGVLPPPPRLAPIEGRGGAQSVVNLSLDGQTFSGLIAPKETADRLVRHAISQQVKSAGRKPGWYR